MRILFATDGSRGARVAEDFLLAQPLSVEDRVTVLTVAPEPERGAEAVVAQAQARLAARGITTTVVVRRGPVTEAIERLALERAEELVTIGSRGLGTIAGLLLGSTGRVLARRAPVSLLVVRDRSGPAARVLAAVDGSTESESAMDLLARLPLPADAEITLLHVLREPPPVHLLDAALAGELRARRERIEAERAEAALAGATRALRGRSVARTLVERGNPADRIVLRAIAGGVDLIVLGSGGQREPHGLLGTSVVDSVLERAHCAVLVAKPPLAPRVIHAESRRSSTVASLTS